jgi:hypothetical protein
MPRVLPPAARKGTLVPKGTPFQGNQIPPPGSIFGSPATLTYFVLVCIGIMEKIPKHTDFLSDFLKYYVTEFDKMLQKDKSFRTRMMVVLRDLPTGDLVLDCLKLKVKQYIETMEKDVNRQSKMIGVLLHRNFGVFQMEDNHSVDLRPREGNNDFQDLFDTIWLEMFPDHTVQEREENEYFLSLRPKVGFSDVEEVHSYPPLPQATIETSESSEALCSLDAILAQTYAMPHCITDTPVEVVHEQVEPASAPNNDDDVETTNLFAENAVQNAVESTKNAQNLTISARFVTTYHPASPESKELLNESIKALEYAKSNTDSAVLLDAVTTAGGSIPSHLLVANSDHISPVTSDYVPDNPTDYFDTSSEIPSLKNVINGDAEAAALFAATISPNPPLSGQHQFDPQNHANGDGGPLSVVQENKDGAYESPLPVGERRAPFTTSAQFPQQCVGDGAPGAQPNSSSSNLGSTPSSGQSGTTLTHDFSQSFPKSSFTPADSKSIVPSPEGTGIGVSPPAHSSSNPSGNVSDLPLPNLQANSDPTPSTKSSSSRRNDIGVGGAHFWTGCPRNALFHVDVRWDPHANQSSFSPQGNGGPPVQVLAQSGNPSDSGGADQPETQSSLNLLRSCIPRGKTRNATQCQNRQNLQSSGWREFFQWRRKLNQVNPSQGETGDTRSQVTHSSGKIPSESAATNQPLSHSIILPTGRTDIGGSGSSQVGTDPTALLPPPNLFGTNGKQFHPLPPTPVNPPSWGTDIGGSSQAHSPDNPPEFVLPPSAAPLNEKPPTLWGVKIGGTSSDGVGSQLVDVEWLVQKVRCAKARPPPPSLWIPRLIGESNLTCQSLTA